MKRLRVVGFTTLRQASSQPISSPRHLSVPPLRHRSGSISRFSFSRAFATPSEPPKEQKDNDSSIDLDGKATQAQPSASDQVTSSKIDPPLSIDILAQAEEQQNYRERSERNPDAYKTSIERRREKFAYWGYLALPGILVGGLLILGQSWDDREAQAHPDIPQGWAPGQVYARARTRLAESLGYYTEPAFPQLLPNVDPAYKPPYTLVLSLEDLLVSSKWSRQNGWEVAKRPGLDYFIRYLSQYYELVLFTSVPSMNGEPVYRKLDPFHFIMFPLFREGTRYMNGEHVKDLSYLNRDLSKTIIIDTDPAHTQLQPENAVILPKWSGKPKDERAADLVSLIPFLEYIAGMNIEDVRKVVKSYEGKKIPEEYARREAQARERFSREHGVKSRAPGAGLGNVLGFKPQPQPGQLLGEQSMAEGIAQGKMLIDQVRERGQLQYRQLENEIRVNGEKWLEEQDAEEKKMMEEQMKTMKNEWLPWPSKVLGTREQQQPKSERS